MRRKIVTVLAAFACAIGFGVFTTGPAYAAPPTVVVCNAYESVDNLLLYNETAAVSVYVNQNQCQEITDVNGAARVDVDPSGGEADVNSWKKKTPRGSWGPCYNNEDGASNPYSGSSADNSTVYRTYARTGC